MSISIEVKNNDVLYYEQMKHEFRMKYTREYESVSDMMKSWIQSV